MQTHLLVHLNTRIVVPLLLPHAAPLPAPRLNPSFDIESKRYVMVTQFMASVPSFEPNDVAGNLGHHHDQIAAALDILFQGF